MKYLWMILLFVCGFFVRGLFFTAPEDLKINNTSVKSVGIVDSVIIETVTEQDSTIASYRKRISDLSIKLLAARKTKSNGINPVVINVQQKPNLEASEIIIEDSALDTITIDQKVKEFTSIRTFYPDDYIVSKVMAYGPAPADSLGNNIAVDYNGYYQDRIRPKLKNNQWVLKDLALASGFGFLLGYLASEIINK